MSSYGNRADFAAWKQQVKELGRECGASIDETSCCPNVHFAWGRYQIIAYLYSSNLKPSILMCIGSQSEWLTTDYKDMLEIIRNWFAD